MTKPIKQTHRILAQCKVVHGNKTDNPNHIILTIIIIVIKVPQQPAHIHNLFNHMGKPQVICLLKLLIFLCVPVGQ